MLGVQLGAKMGNVGSSVAGMESSSVLVFDNVGFNNTPAFTLKAMPFRLSDGSPDRLHCTYRHFVYYMDSAVQKGSSKSFREFAPQVCRRSLGVLQANFSHLSDC